MGETSRTTIGIAIDIPPPWGEMLTRRRAAAGDPAAEHVPAHLTLLGPTEIDTAGFPEIERHLAAVAERQPSFPLLLRGTGTFRPVTDVVFVSVATGISECERLHNAVLDTPVIQRERRFPYHPHVTVAHDVAPDQLDAVFADLARFEATIDIVGFALFEHCLQADADAGAQARWRVRREYRLCAQRVADGDYRRR